MWYILPIVFGFLGGIMAVLIIRKSDPRKALICVIVGTAVSGLWIAWIFLPDDETDFVPTEGLTPKEREELYYSENPSQKIIEAVSSGEEMKQREVLKQKEKVVQTAKQLPKQLPTSCYGVDSMELDIYPTGKQCFAALNKRVEEWCLSQSKDCVTQFYLKLADTCEDPVIGSVEVCLMYTFKEVYPKLIP